MNYILRVGDMLETNGFFGLITKIHPETVEYWARNNPKYPGELFNENKVKVYDYIERGECVVHLGSLKRRRKRKK